MYQNFIEKLNENMPLTIAILLGLLASILRTEEHTLRSVITGVIFAGFVAYTANLGLMGYESIDDNLRVVLVGCLTYLNRYVLEILNKLGAGFADDPKGALANIKELWKR